MLIGLRGAYEGPTDAHSRTSFLKQKAETHVVDI
jgi:hypothetical protein